MHDFDSDDGHSTEYMRVLDAKETLKGDLQITLRFPNLSLLEEFWQLSCAPDIMALKVIPDVKELTEALGIFYELKHFIYKEGYKEQHPKLLITVVGDGSTPRLGALCAFRTWADVISIDPQMKLKNLWPKHIERLAVYNKRFEDVASDLLSNVAPQYDRRVWLLPHSHINMNLFVKTLHDNRVNKQDDILITNPCCVSSHFSGDYAYFYKNPGWRLVKDKTNWGIHSPYRRILTWLYMENGDEG